MGVSALRSLSRPISCAVEYEALDRFVNVKLHCHVGILLYFEIIECAIALAGSSP